MVAALAVAFVGLRPGAPRPRHLLRHRPLHRLRGDHGLATASCASCCASCSRPSASPPPARTASPSPLAPLVGVGLVYRRGALQDRPGPGRRLERGHTEPRVAAARLGLRRRAAQRRSDRRHAARRAGPGGRASRRSPTACCWPASRCSCSRPCRPPCCRGSAGSPRATSSSSSAPGCKRLLIVVIAVGVVGTTARSCSARS